jgi:hypothetical protein
LNFRIGDDNKCLKPKVEELGEFFPGATIEGNQKSPSSSSTGMGLRIL